MKKCPYCAENIQDEAIYCRYCKHDLQIKIENKQDKPIHQETANVSPARPLLWKKGTQVAVAIGLFGLFFIAALIIGIVLLLVNSAVVNNAAIATPTPVHTPVHTLVPTLRPTAIPTPTHIDCIPTSQVTPDMQGKFICAYGIIFWLKETPATSANNSGRRWTQLYGLFLIEHPPFKEGDCIYMQGQILLSSEGKPYMKEYTVNKCESWMK